MNRYSANVNRIISFIASHISLLILIGCSWAQTATASCKYVITSEWDTGFIAAIRISNDGSAPIKGWTLSWRYNKDSISGSWNSALTGSNPYSATNLDWNTVINPGQTIQLGLEGRKGSSAAEKPILTGSVCGSSGSSSSSSSAGIVSNYFSNDAEAKALWNGERTVTMPTYSAMADMGLPWRVINAQRLLGLESEAIATGNTIDAAAFKVIDQRLADREKIFAADALRLPNYQDIWAPQFRDNLPQNFGVHVMVRVLDLLNRGPRKYNQINNECLLANVIPNMCGSLVDMGTTDGSFCKSGAPLREKQIIQMPDLYSFSNVRRQITADELPEAGSPIANTCMYASTLVHEFTHDVDLTFNDNFTNMQYDRLEHCSSELMNFRKLNSPFMQNIQAGTQNRDEYISGYAAGLTNETQDYRFWEDAAETVTAYVVFPEYFRSKAALNAKLKARYDYIKTEIFGGVEFRNKALENQTLADADASTVPGLCWRVKEFRMDDIVVK